MILYPELKKGDEVICKDKDLFKAFTGYNIKGELIVQSANAFQVTFENGLTILQPEYYLFDKA